MTDQPTPTTHFPVATIVKQYRKGQGLSLRDFAQQLPYEGSISHGSVHNWEQGTHNPDYSFLMGLILHTGDWRLDFALDCLSVMRPGDYEPQTEIGRRARDQYLNK